MVSAVRYSIMDSPLGSLTLASSVRGLASVQFGLNMPFDGVIDDLANREAMEQLREYFDGKRSQFDLPLDVAGTPFQLAVWNELRKIPYGSTCSYIDIARSLGKPGAARAVGMANHENPIAIVIPCHRVVGSDGSLTGYAGGLHLKQQLLGIEKQTQLLFT
jgi:methylated-DNA-[protein]-cysteine S-methyltransferase